MTLTALLMLAVLLEAAAIGVGVVIFGGLRFTIAALIQDATTDALTAVPNRRAANNRLAARLAARAVVSVALIDIDDFKGINDTYGHHVGDAALRYVAARLNEAASPYMVARYAGDEFLIVITGGIGLAEIVARAAVRRIQEIPFEYFGKPIDVALSIGVAIADDTNSPTELIQRADHAMYHAKRTTPNDDMPVVTWTPGLRMPSAADEPRRRAFRQPFQASSH